jgi:hypothetical protein
VSKNRDGSRSNEGEHEDDTISGTDGSRGLAGMWPAPPFSLDLSLHNLCARVFFLK